MILRHITLGNQEVLFLLRNNGITIVIIQSGHKQTLSIYINHISVAGKICSGI